MANTKDINTSQDNTHRRDYLTIPPIPKTVWSNLVHFIAFGFGSGIIPFAPGTCGTLIAIPFYLVMQYFNPLWYLVTTLMMTAASMWICEKTSKDIQVHDHQGMNLDEVVGYIVTMFLAPHGWWWILLGFILFRFFDIWKPWPIRFIDKKVHGGIGVILDDVLAGLFSFAIIQWLALFLRG